MCKNDLEILETAKGMLDRREADFICHALEYAGQDLAVPEPAKRLERQVMHHLQPFDTYGGWLVADNSVTATHPGYPYFRIGRLMWLDLMIEAAKEGKPVPPPPIPPGLLP